MNSSRERASSYLEYLPAIYKEKDSEFLGRFLKIFEKLWSGIDDGIEIESRGKRYQPLEETVEYLYCYFHPDKAPREFLPHLASWVLLLPDEEDIFSFDALGEEQRSLIKEAVDLHKIRGTLPGLEYYLRSFYLRFSYKKYRFHFSQGLPLYGEKAQKLEEDEALVEIVENYLPLKGMVIGISSTIGIDSNLIDPVETTWSFTVFIHTKREIPKAEIDQIKRIIEAVKPAHTSYYLKVCLSEG